MVKWYSYRVYDVLAVFRAELVTLAPMSIEVKVDVRSGKRFGSPPSLAGNAV
jgi:hypothetical protein